MRRWSSSVSRSRVPLHDVLVSHQPSRRVTAFGVVTLPPIDRSVVAVVAVAVDDGVDRRVGVFTQHRDHAVEHPNTGRLIGGMILDGADIASLNADYPLLERLSEERSGIDAALTYALVIGWELFGPSLLAATGTTMSPDALAGKLATALRAIGEPDPERRP